MNTPELIGHGFLHRYNMDGFCKDVEHCRFTSGTNLKCALALTLYWNQTSGSRMTSVSIRHVVLSTPCFFYDVKYDTVIICGLSSDL